MQKNAPQAPINLKNDPPNSFREGIVFDHSHTQHKPGHLKMAEILQNQNLKNNINLYNLGEGFKYNQSTEYSKIHYPLTKEILIKTR